MPPIPTNPALQDPFARLLGLELLDVSDGYAKVKFLAQPQHCNALGMIHGGALFTLADYAFAAACNSHGIPTVAINAHISYVKAAYPGTLYAEAREAVNSKIGLSEIRITNEAGDLIAVFQGLSYQKRPTVPAS